MRDLRDKSVNGWRKTRAKCLSTIALLAMPAVAAAIVSAPAEPRRDWTAIEIVLSFGILLFTIVLIIVEAVIISRAAKPWAPRSILRVIGLTLILCLSTLLVVAGYSKDQITPVIGLLGVIAGYLLGANEQQSAPVKD